jgi:hypothetical protein
MGVFSGRPAVSRRPYFEVYLALTKRPMPVYADTMEPDPDGEFVNFYRGNQLVFTIRKGRFVMARRV